MRYNEKFTNFSACCVEIVWKKKTTNMSGDRLYTRLKRPKTTKNALKKAFFLNDKIVKRLQGSKTVEIFKFQRFLTYWYTFLAYFGPATATELPPTETSLIVHVFISTDVEPLRPRSCWTTQCKLFLYGLVKSIHAPGENSHEYFWGELRIQGDNFWTS